MSLTAAISDRLKALHEWQALTYRYLWYALAATGVPALCLLIWVLIPQRLPGNVTPVEQVAKWVEPLRAVSFDEAGFTQLLRSDLALPQAPYEHAAPAQWRNARLPDVIPLPATSDVLPYASHRVWLRFKYSVPADHVAHQPIGVYITRIMGGGGGGGVYSLWVNGQLVSTNTDQWRMQWNHPLLVSLPLHLTPPGAPLDIALGMPFRPAQGYAVGSTMVGPYAALEPYRALRALVQNTLPQATLFVVVLMGLMSLHFWLKRRNEATHLLLWLSSVAFLICNMQWVADFSGQSTLSLWFGSLVDSAIGWAIVLICLFTFRVDGRSLPWFEWLAALTVLLLTVVTLPFWEWQKNALLLQHYVHVMLGMVFVGILVWRCMSNRSAELCLLTASLLCMLLFGVHDLSQITSQTSPDSVFLFPYTVVLVFGSFVFANQRSYLAALLRLDGLNQTLQEGIALSTAQIQQQHEQLAKLGLRESLIQERQRMANDIHDGLGSALTTAITLLERGPLLRQSIEAALQDCLMETRAVIDTLQMEPGNLQALLNLLQERLNPRLQAAGLAAQWVLRPLPAVAWLDQTASNELARSLQEILVNVVKHAKAQQVRILALHQKAQGVGGVEGIELRVEDDGQGFDPTQITPGRGLKNLQVRAHKLKGHVRIDTGGAGLTRGRGTQISLWIPL